MNSVTGRERGEGPRFRHIEGVSLINRRVQIDRIVRLDRRMPAQVALLLQPVVDVQQLVTLSKTVIRAYEDCGFVSCQPHSLPEEPVDGPVVLPCHLANSKK